MKLNKSPLPQKVQESLREYLHRTEFETLVTVIESLAFEKEAEALNAMAELGKGFPAYEDRIKVVAVEVSMLTFMSEKLKELKAQTAPFTTATATP